LYQFFEPQFHFLLFCHFRYTEVFFSHPSFVFPFSIPAVFRGEAGTWELPGRPLRLFKLGALLTFSEPEIWFLVTFFARCFPPLLKGVNWSKIACFFLPQVLTTPLVFFGRLWVCAQKLVLEFAPPWLERQPASSSSFLCTYSRFDLPPPLIACLLPSLRSPAVAVSCLAGLRAASLLLSGPLRVPLPRY